MSTTTVSNDMTIDEALQEVNEKYDTKISESDSEIQGMIDDHAAVINSQITASKKWAEDQTKLQNEQTDFTIQQINQQKEQAEKDYIKEQSGAYKDWQKQSDKYGVNAEQMASSGMKGSGYSESSQVAMYNQYQSRVTTAREVHNRSVLAYDNSIKEARLQNNSILAEIAYNALVAQNELALTGLQYKNGLILEKANRKLELESMRNEEWYEILKQMNAENGNSTTDSDGENGDTTLPIKPPVVTDTDGNTTSDNTSNDSGTGVTEEDVADVLSDIRGEYPVNTEYYRGNKNMDAHIYGTFKNGYQPKGITGHGKLKDSEKKITFTTTTLSGEEKTVTQKVWKAEDGTKWYWDGRYNKYLEYKKNDESGKKLETPEITDNTDSLIKMGLGEASPSKIAQLISEGKVTYTLENDMRYYSWSDPMYRYLYGN